jgi:cytochrome c5
VGYNRRRFTAREKALRAQDSQFFDSFMLVIGILMGVALGLFFLVRAISLETQGLYIMEDPTVQAEINERIKPVGRVLLLGDAELAAAAAAAVAAPTPVATVMTGPQVYNAACIVCHQPPGVGGAPPVGDVAAWAPRIAKGIDTLYEHALKGFQGTPTTFMPAKGGRPDLSDGEITAAVDYLVEQSK